MSIDDARDCLCYQIPLRVRVAAGRQMALSLCLYLAPVIHWSVSDVHAMQRFVLVFSKAARGVLAPTSDWASFYLVGAR